MPISSKEYQRLAPDGCTWKYGDKLTMLSQDFYRKRIEPGATDFLCGGLTKENGWGSTGWKFLGARCETNRGDDNHGWEIEVRAPDGCEYTMMDFEFVEFWQRAGEIIIDSYQIY